MAASACDSQCKSKVIELGPGGVFSDRLDLVSKHQLACVSWNLQESARLPSPVTYSERKGLALASIAADYAKGPICRRNFVRCLSLVHGTLYYTEAVSSHETSHILFK